MEFIAEGSVEDVVEAVAGDDIRVISIIWRNTDGAEGRPRIDVTGMSDYEALGLLKVAALYYERVCEALFDGDQYEDEEEDEGVEDA